MPTRNTGGSNGEPLCFRHKVGIKSNPEVPSVIPSMCRHVRACPLPQHQQVPIPSRHQREIVHLRLLSCGRLRPPHVSCKITNPSNYDDLRQIITNAAKSAIDKGRTSRRQREACARRALLAGARAMSAARGPAAPRRSLRRARAGAVAWGGACASLLAPTCKHVHTCNHVHTYRHECERTHTHKCREAH